MKTVHTFGDSEYLAARRRHKSFCCCTDGLNRLYVLAWSPHTQMGVSISYDFNKEEETSTISEFSLDSPNLPPIFRESRSSHMRLFHFQDKIFAFPTRNRSLSALLVVELSGEDQKFATVEPVVYPRLTDGDWYRGYAFSQLGNGQWLAYVLYGELEGGGLEVTAITTYLCTC